MTARATHAKAKRRRSERVTWRLDPGNFDLVDQERTRMGLASMNAALNVILAQYRQYLPRSHGVTEETEKRAIGTTKTGDR